MNEFGINDIFGLASYAIKKRKPTAEGDIPTIEDLEAEVEKLRTPESAEMPPEIVEPSASVISEKATDVATGCVPCSIGHLGTCSGLLNEAMRFARDGGIESEEVIGRVNMCLDELNTLERVDLRPEMIVNLPEWEKTLAEKALNLSRTLRHDLEQLPSAEVLEGIAAKTQGTRQEIGKTWMVGRLKRMTPEQRKIVENELRERAAISEER